MKRLFTSAYARALVVAALAIAGCSKTDEPKQTAAGSDAPVLGEHANHEDHSIALTPPPGARWPTDEPLRAAMTRLQTALGQAQRAQENGALDTASAQALAQSVEKEVAFMIENCKLPPQADAALHVLIGRMLSAAGRLKQTPADDSAVPELADVLKQYAETFDHPDWRSL